MRDKIENILSRMNSGQDEPNETIEKILNLKRPCDVKDRKGVEIHFGDTLIFADKVEWYRSEYGPKVSYGEMTKKDALEQIESLPYETIVIKSVQDYEWLLSDEIQSYWEIKNK